MNPSESTSRGLRHELRTPLNQIIGYCEMMMEEAEDGAAFPTLVEDLQKMHAAGRRLLGVVDDVLDPVKAAMFLKNPGMLDHEIRTPINQIIGYAEMLQEEARDRGGATLADDLQRVHVAARELNRRFFDQLAPHGKLEPQVLIPQIPAREPQPAGAARSVRPPAHTGSILIAEDDEVNRTMLQRRLIRMGHLVTTACDGRQAMERLGAAPFDLVLLDMQMPRMSGIEVLTAMKDDPRLSSIPVIILSASAESDRVAPCIELGAEDYLTKPFDAVVLRARINACLEKSLLRESEARHMRQIEHEKRQLKAALDSLELAQKEAALLDSVTQRINAGVSLGQVLDHIFESFESIIPFDRVGCSLIEGDGRVVRSRWSRSRLGNGCMPEDYSAPLSGGSLRAIIESGAPRILNDLEAYLTDHPTSESTRMMVQEGMRSSLTCPLISMESAVGFLFFSSVRAGAYRPSHVGTFMRVANQLSMIVRKGVIFDEIGEELHRSQDRLAHTQAQLLAAQHIQQRLLPRAAPQVPGLDIAGACYPSYFTSGDYFNYLPLSDGSLLLVIADVTGHGVGPALVAATVHAYLISLAEKSCEIDEMASRLNGHLIREIEEGRFVTLLLVRLDPRSRSLVFVNAGHPPGYVLDAAGNLKYSMESNSLPLGLYAKERFAVSKPIPLDRGDRVFMMTDGIFEARSPDQKLLGLARTLQLLAEYAGHGSVDLISAMRDAVYAFTGRKIPEDDVTAVAVGIGDLV